MSILALNDNALFIRNWRERMRLPSVASASLIVFLLISIIFIGYYLNRDIADAYDSITKTYHVLPWLHKVFFNLAVLQGVVLLLFGTVSANKMALKERVGGTLDFHRSSPTSRINQIIGLVFGAPVLEWSIFLFTLPISAYIVLVTKITFLTFVSFYAALAVSAIFLHSLVVLIAISSPQKHAQLGFFPMLLLLWFFFPLVFSLQLSTVYHMTWFPAYESLWKDIMGSGVSRSYAMHDLPDILHSFFGQKMHYLLLLAIVQLPLIVLMWTGIKRKISYSERPLLSKGQVALLSLLVLFYYCGSAISAFLIDEKSWFYESYVYIFFYLVFILAILGALAATPTHLSFTKGLRRIRKLGLKRISFSDDQNSNMLWIFTYCFMVSVAYFTICYSVRSTISNQIAYLIVLLSQIVYFASALEFFRLSRYHQKKIFFWTAIAILWFILPLFGVVTKPIIASRAYPYYFFAPSPLVSTAFFTSILLNKPIDPGAFPVAFCLIVNLTLAVAMVLAASYQRYRIKSEASVGL